MTTKPPTERRQRPRSIRPRLIGVLLIPTVAAVVLGATRTVELTHRSNELARSDSLARALPDAFQLALQLQVERDAGSRTADATTLGRIRMATDDQVDRWHEDTRTIDTDRSPALRSDLAAIDHALGDLDTTRDRLGRASSRGSARSAYTTTLNALLGLAQRLPGLDDPELYQEAAALAQIRPAAEALGDQGEVLAAALADGAVDAPALTALADATSRWNVASLAFARQTTPGIRLKVEQATGVETQTGETAAGNPLQNAIARLLATGDASALGLDADEVAEAQAAFFTTMAGIVVSAADELEAHVHDEWRAARTDALTSTGLIALALLVALIEALLVARSIIGPLRDLRDAALAIAHRELPQRVRALDANADGHVDTGVRAIDVGGRSDEITEVAGAFDAVHAEAVRLAAEQARMRATVNAMLVNLSRRNQGLLDRQLRLIDELEAGEQDPDGLESLFRLDHLATRMRRNGENLMVIAGGDASRRQRGDLRVLDVVRAAVGEVEHYARVELGDLDDSGTMVQGQVAGDLVHLLAELIENATSFSSPDTTVEVHSHTDAADLVIEVADHGIGMTADELDAANRTLRGGTAIDPDVARMMGLTVAARLAQRQGLAVGLRANVPSGVVARIRVPAAALAGRTPAGAPPAR
ncbi:MAG: nitrate- and nitrite sensing domain-containing protein, partial [Nocardioides sp.]|uniref:sensor histidine kinase n=1 Tax=Nocardioides sp. TaxID=35761 RepID=UPI0039E62E44